MMKWISCMLIAVCAALSACTKTVYVPTETVRTEYKDRVVENLRTDTVALRDSVAVYINGDTVKITKYRDRWRTRTEVRRDTVTSVRTDSVAVPYPVERKLTKWEQTKQDCGEFAIAFMVVALAVIAWLVIKRRKE